MNNLERIASFHDLSFKKIHDDEANVGVITNGFGLSMASMDLIHNMHGRSACYMDLSIASSIEDVLYGLDLMEYDKRVKVVLINIFGGGADVQRITEGIMVSKKMNVITKPMVVRLKGIHEKEARKHLEEFMKENN